MSRAKIHLFAFILCVIFVVPIFFVKAQNANEYELLSPLPFITSSGSDTNTTPKEYVEGIIKLAIALAGAFAVLKIVWAGFQYVTTENFMGKSSAKEDIKTALVGLFLAIGAFTILTTLNPALTDLAIEVQTVGSKNALLSPETCSKDSRGECIEPLDKCEDGRVENINGDLLCVRALKDGERCTGKIIGRECATDPYKSKPGGTITDEVWADDSDKNIRAYLERNIGIKINADPCTYVGQSACTSVRGLGQSIVNGLALLKKDCDEYFKDSGTSCDIILTGGTEYWLHGNRSTDINLNKTEHKPNHRVVDLSEKTNLKEFLQKKGRPAPKSDECVRYEFGKERYLYGGGLYVLETIPKNPLHWHVCYL